METIQGACYSDSCHVVVATKIEQHEEAQQIRRSAKTDKSTIVEGNGRGRYKAHFIKFLIYALSSNDETVDHLETLFETRSLTDELLYNELHLKLDQLGKNSTILYKQLNEVIMISKFSIKHPTSGILCPVSSIKYPFLNVHLHRKKFNQWQKLK